MSIESGPVSRSAKERKYMTTLECGKKVTAQRNTNGGQEWLIAGEDTPGYCLRVSNDKVLFQRGDATDKTPLSRAEKEAMMKAVAALAGLVLYAQTDDETYWVSGAERWMTPEMIVESVLAK